MDGLTGYLEPTETASRSRIALTSAPIGVSDGDYFECLVWQNSGTDQDVEADPQTWFALVALEFAAFRGAMRRVTATEPVTASTDVAIPWDATVYATDAFWSAGNPTRLTVPAGVSQVRLMAKINWTFGASGYRHVWCTRTAPCSSARPRRAILATAACRASAAPRSTSHPATTWSSSPPRTSGSTKNVAADELTRFAIEVVD